MHQCDLASRSAKGQQADTRETPCRFCKGRPAGPDLHLVHLVRFHGQLCVSAVAWRHQPYNAS